MIKSLLPLFIIAPLSAATFDQVRPILEISCVECHSDEKDKGDLKLHTKAGLIAGGETGEVVNFEKVDDSELLRRVLLAHDDDEFMPPSSKKKERQPLSTEEIAILKSWITAKAPWPEKVTLVAKERGPILEDPSAPDLNLASIAVYPSSVTLETKRDSHRLIALATAKDATTRDVTTSAKFTIKDPSLVKIEGTTLTPLKDGSTSVTIDFRGQSVEVPVTVKGAVEDRKISFQQDVVPVFTASGCNTGSCHGSARGQDGFMLSLFGYDPEGDYYRITREQSGRRINLALPKDSLLLTKSIGAVPHTGGKLFEKDHPFYKTLLEWVKDGAPIDAADISLPVKIEVEPKEFLLEGSGKKIPLTVKATYSDGTDRDVTALSSYTTSNDTSVGIDASSGLAVSKKRGEAFLMARFHTFTEGAQSIVIPDGLKYERPQIAVINYIDTHVHEKLNKLRVIPSDVCSDEVFLRRVTLDITGLLPTEEERSKFLANTNPKKREALVDQLLDRKEFTEIWVMKWAELLQIRSTGGNANDISYKAALLWYEKLRAEIAENRPFNKIIHDILASRGGTFANPSTNYYKLEGDVKVVTENVAQVFMGTRIQCAQCHNHPFDRWTMDDYYGFASFFSQVKRKRAEDPSEQIIYDGGGEIKHPLTNQNALPKFLGGAMMEGKDKTRREAVAEWLTAPENPWFASNVANIMWSHFFGIGIVDPVDDIRISNPATNPQLLDALGEKFVEYNFDMKKLVRDICTSRTYQLSTRANETNKDDLTNFSHARIRRLRAEVLLDTLAQTTNTPNKFKGLPLGSRAVQIADGNTSTYFLTTFGRATRKTVCSCEVKMEPNLSQALHLLNGESVHNRIERGKIVPEFLKEKKPPEEVLRSLYRKTLTREPTDPELSKLLETVSTAKDENDKKAILEDIFWALLNSKEYLFNH
ncbi:PSD1 and planctomycete cytochrome C domain-containing protein [Akkermansiaceae bacterium]|nr:PSD1 and planctomycete cytochrome C domain-containing protein [Akkermansiaceae bacterium]MDB4288442.1 PSD1 and planctomycete cytochrome C domain-containing protein [bacterium]MDB4267868.1 PSD1 and planctomycete cytochrome C domain-containing protein [Akkermansiaceae bacterium]MDB4313580.1 PSD1 and planctomycete cytochrome C domain-containing protein [Akkermansiaceae bacterium]MDB4323130.1 PSD1 and planctomycete cytochrome C domain-containing protein [Akkermansiaceae bacterium]